MGMTQISSLASSLMTKSRLVSN